VKHLKVNEQPGNNNLRVIWETGSTLYLLVNLQMLNYIGTPLEDPLRSAQSQPILDIENYVITCHYSTLPSILPKRYIVDVNAKQPSSTDKSSEKRSKISIYYE